MEKSIFAMELCMPFELGSSLRGRLYSLLVKHPILSSPGQKWELYSQARRLLLPALPSAVSGCWDFYDTDRADADFAQWRNGLYTREGARKQPAPGADPYRAEQLYLTFTMALLLKRNATCERELCAAAAFPQDRLWHRDTFARLLNAMALVNFAYVAADVVYLIPGADRWGLTADDLRAEKFRYLRPIV